MTSTSQVRIAGLGLWLPGHASVSAWIEGRADAAAAQPVGHALGRMYRRRASGLGRALADAVADALVQADVDPASVRTVIGSSIAEASTMLGLLEQIWRRKEPVSPAAFTMSVHNAASGLLSIACGNRGFTTSLAADDDTPAVALLEAVGLVQTLGQPVVVACADESAPPDLVADDQLWDMLASALVLVPADAPGPSRGLLRLVRPGSATLPRAGVEPGLGRNPQIGLVDLVDAVARGEQGCVALDRGGGLGYCAEFEPDASR